MMSADDRLIGCRCATVKSIVLVNVEHIGVVHRRPLRVLKPDLDLLLSLSVFSAIFSLPRHSGMGFLRSGFAISLVAAPWSSCLFWTFVYLSARDELLHWAFDVYFLTFYVFC